MRVRLTTDRVDRGAFQQEGQEVELPDAEARRLVRANQAEEIKAPAGPPRPPKRR